MKTTSEDVLQCKSVGTLPFKSESVILQTLICRFRTFLKTLSLSIHNSKSDVCLIKPSSRGKQKTVTHA